ncbi:MAG: tetratricopeptide repeat protein [Cyclobacteriaceae bacterium]|nr:tetratricopeptide repeat protein [Cyclobacteriaceae bacterium]
MSQQNKAELLVKRYTRLALFSAFLLALLWPLGNFFIWIFLGATAYFFFLALYYQPRKVSAQRKQPHSKEIPPITDGQKKTIVLAIIVVSAVVIVFAGIIALVSIAEEENTYSDNTNEGDRAVLQKNPGDINALTNIGNQLYNEAQYDSALYYYERVLKLDPQNSSCLYNKALVFYQQEDYSRSMEWLRKCISLYPDNADAHAVMGDNYLAIGNNNEALRWYLQAYDKGADNSQLLYVIATLYNQQNNTTMAIRFYKETLARDSSFLSVYVPLAELEPEQAGRYKAMAER